MTPDSFLALKPRAPSNPCSDLPCSCVPSFCTGCVTAVFALFFSNAVAQPFPAKPVRMVVPFAAGGGTDVIGRLVAQKLLEAWGQQVIVENRAGGGSVIGTEIVARSAPDGYTLLLTAPPFTTNAALLPKLSYDSLHDFAPVTLAAFAPLIVVVHPSLPARSVKDLVAIAKARPGQLSYGSSGNGGPQHLAAVQEHGRG